MKLQNAKQPGKLVSVSLILAMWIIVNSFDFIVSVPCLYNHPNTSLTFNNGVRNLNLSNALLFYWWSL